VTSSAPVRYAVAASLLVAASAAGVADSVIREGEPVVATPVAGVDTRGAALLMTTPDSGEIGGAVTWTWSAVPGQGGDVELRFVVEVDGEALLIGSPSEPISVEIVAYLLDASGALAAHSVSEVVLEGADERQRVHETGLKHRGGFPVPVGRYSLRLLVRNRATGRYCLIRRELDPELGGTGAPALLPPMVAESTDRWFRTLQPDLRAADRPDDPTDPRVWPSARPAWRADQPLAILVAGAAVGNGNQLAARIEDSSGRVVFEPELRVGGARAAGTGMDVVEAVVEAPRLPGGAYRLVISTGTGDRRIDGSLSVWIHDRPDQLAWTDLTEVRIEPEERDVLEDDETMVAAAGQVGAASVQTTASDLGVAPSASYSGVPLVEIPVPGVDARGAALLLSGQSGGEIEGAVTWTVADDEDPADGVALRVVVEVDGTSLLSDTGTGPVPIEFVVYLFDDQNRLVAHVSTGVVLDTDDEIGGVLGAGLKHVGGLTAPDGRCSLRVLVHNRASGHYFLARRDLDLELGGPGVPVLVPPIVAEPPERWVKTVQPDLAEELEARPHDPREWPAARPAWRSDQPLAVTLAGAAVADGRPLAARLEDSLGRTVVEPRVHLETPVASDSPLGLVRAEVEAPDLPAGEYRLVIFVGDLAEERSSDRSLWVSIHDRPEELVWTDLQETGSRTEPPRIVPDEGPSQRELAHESMRAAYRAALQAWAEDDRVAARRIVGDLERPVAATTGTRAWRELVAAEGSVLSELAADRPEVLLAAVLLNRDLYQWYRARGEGALARHAWESAALLAIEAEDLDGWRPPAGFTEAVLLDLADHLVQSRQPDAARQLLEAAEKIAPSSPRPLLALGALAERSGRPEDAIRPLRRLVELEPGHLEARLRLGVCDARVGDGREAEELFRELLAPEVTPWIRALAYQELGRLLVAADRPRDAVAVLMEGSSEIPGNQRLRILLAHAFDAVGQPQQAASVLAAIGSWSGPMDESPRYRYSQWPALDRSQFQAVLAEADSIARDALREALT